MSDLLKTLVELTRTIGQPERDYVIVGEGNTSCRVDEDTFYVKASGHQMHRITEGGFVQVKFAPVLAMLDNPPETRTEMNAVLKEATVNPETAPRPSVEVSFHAMLLHECNVPFIGHTHPTAINQILCSSPAEQFAKKRVFPDSVVLCGPESVFVPYTDPGLPLAIEMREYVRAYMQKHEEAPKVILLASHGLIALGETPAEILNVTAMAVKSATIFMGACAIGEPVFMSEEDVMHIYKRPDEIYRRGLFVEHTTQGEN